MHQAAQLPVDRVYCPHPVVELALVFYRRKVNPSLATGSWRIDYLRAYYISNAEVSIR